MSLIDIRNLTFAYEGSYDTVFEDVNLQLDTSWRLGLVGRNGRGKTTFLHILSGKYDFKGKVSAKVTFEYFPFEVTNREINTIDIIDEILIEYEYWQLIREINLLEVSQDVLYRPFSTLSNGEQTKILLAALFLKENSFLLIDEPTNHLDSNARQLVANYLAQKSGYILVSHDRTFLDICTDHILSINKQNIEIQKGNYSSWQRVKMAKDEAELAQSEKLKKRNKTP